jgi:hypothetical protein
MMTDEPNNLVLEHLKKIHADTAEIKRDIRDMKAEIISLRTIMGEFIKTDARRETDVLGLHIRIERIEARLGLTDV